MGNDVCKSRCAGIAEDAESVQTSYSLHPMTEMLISPRSAKASSKPKEEREVVYPVAFKLRAGAQLGALFLESDKPGTDGSLTVTFLANDSPLRTPPSGDRGACRGDVIVAVDEQTGTGKQLLNLIQESRKRGGTLLLLLRVRLQVFEVCLVKSPKQERLGVAVTAIATVRGRIVVQRVNDNGALASWNSQNPGRQVVGGDWILSVNGSSAIGEEMVASMQSLWAQDGRLALEVGTPFISGEEDLSPNGFSARKG